MLTIVARRGLILFALAAIVRIAAGQDRILPRDPQSDPTSLQRFDWQPALRQSITFLTIQQGFRIVTQSSTRTELQGPYFRDWLTSVGNIRGWSDGDPFIANYVGHAMEGAISGYIYVQNDPRARKAEFNDERYWRTRLRALVWSGIYSANYELGPLGDGAIGNVGMQPGTKGAVDLVMTPTVGLGWMIAEDALDKLLILPIERKVKSPTARLLIRSWLNPSRGMANVLRGNWPWYRDTRGGVRE